MIVGIDFDNTIINYDVLFIQAATSHGWLENYSLTKQEVKQGLINKYGDDSKWQILQAEIYGKHITQATLYANCYEFIQLVIQSGATVYIVSHKTEFSNFDGKTKLIEPAIQWLKKKKIVGFQGLIPIKQLSFHATRDEKIKKIRQLNCDIFIDDLAEVLRDKQFPDKTFGILFSKKAQKNLIYVDNWEYLIQFYGLIQKNDFLWLVNTSRLMKSLIVNISPCDQGGNNLLHILKFFNGSKAVVKRATPEKQHLLNNEYKALKLLKQQNIKNIAQALVFSSERIELIQSYLEGKKIDSISYAHIEQVISFILSLDTLGKKKIYFINVGSYRAKLVDYTDAINNRWDAINRGVLQMSTTNSCVDKISDLLQQIKPIKEKILSDFGKQISDNKLNSYSEFLDQEMIFNPSDFGFHNMLEGKNKELYFLDFEYFVYDDKAKMVCDFIHHAGHDLTLEQKLYFLKQLNIQNFFTPNLKQRIKILINLIGFEWLLIILNIAQKDKLIQKIHANPKLSVDQIVETQYDKAQRLFSFFQQNINEEKELFTLGIDQKELSFD